MKARTRDRIVLALFIGMAWVPQLAFPQREWVYDDQAVLRLNESVMHRDFAAIWTTPYWGGVRQVYQKENLHRPIFLSVAALFRDSPALLRFLCVLAHAGIAFLIYRMLKVAIQNRKLAGALAKAPEDEEGSAAILAALGAAFFLAHPATVEVTAQVVGLMDSVPTLLGLAAIPLVASRPALALSLVALAPGWKEGGYVWLAGVALLFWLHGRRGWAMGAGAVIAAWISHRFWVYGELFRSTHDPYALLNPLVSMSFPEALWTRFALIGHYLRLYFLPLGLSSDYSRGTLPLPGYPIQVWTLMGMAFLGWMILRGKRLLNRDQGVVWISFLTLVPVLHLISPALVIFAERFGYAFWAALTVLLFPWVYGIISRLKPFQQRVALSALAFALLGFYSLTLSRHHDWVSAESLFRHDAEAYPANAKLRFNYGVALGAQKRWREAHQELTAAVMLAPDFPEAHYRLGLVYHELGDQKNAQIHRQLAVEGGYGQ